MKAATLIVVFALVATATAMRLDRSRLSAIPAGKVAKHATVQSHPMHHREETSEVALPQLHCAVKCATTCELPPQNQVKSQQQDIPASTDTRVPVSRECLNQCGATCKEMCAKFPNKKEVCDGCVQSCFHQCSANELRKQQGQPELPFKAPTPAEAEKAGKKVEKGDNDGSEGKAESGDESGNKDSEDEEPKKEESEAKEEGTKEASQADEKEDKNQKASDKESGAGGSAHHHRLERLEAKCEKCVNGCGGKCSAECTAKSSAKCHKCTHRCFSDCGAETEDGDDEDSRTALKACMGAMASVFLAM